MHSNKYNLVLSPVCRYPLFDPCRLSHGTRGEASKHTTWTLPVGPLLKLARDAKFRLFSRLKSLQHVTITHARPVHEPRTGTVLISCRFGGVVVGVSLGGCPRKSSR